MPFFSLLDTSRDELKFLHKNFAPSRDGARELEG
jgi:hypothetical protein